MEMQVHGLILSGGKGLRMSGLDKGLQTFRAHSLVSHVLERLIPQTQSIIISANRNQSTYQGYGHTVVTDNVAGCHGPLAGVLSGMNYLIKNNRRQDWLILCPCDAPLVSSSLVSVLTETLSSSPTQENIECVIPYDGKRNQPLFSLISVSCAGKIHDSILANRLKVETCFLSLDSLIVDMSDQADSFTNINSLKQLSEIQ